MVLRNTVWNFAGVGVEMAAAFFLAPFLITRLGEDTYSTFVILGSVVSTMGLLDLGVRGAVGRLVAFHRAKGDLGRVGEILSCSLAVMAGLGLVALAGVAAASAGFAGALRIPAEQAAEARPALLVMGLGLFLSLALNPFDSTLWGFQRFDWLNMVDIPVALLRTGLAMAVVAGGGGLLGLAVVTTGTLAAAGLAKAVLAFRAEPGLALGVGRVTRGAARELFGFSVWVLAGTALRVIRAQAGPFLIARLVVYSLVAPYAIADRLATVPGVVIMTMTGVLAPAATRLFALDRKDEQQRLFVQFGRLTFALAVLLTVLLVALGRPFLGLYIAAKPDVAAAAYPMLVVLALGEFLATATTLARSLILAAAEHRKLAYLGAAELAAVGGLAWLLAEPYGVLGICVALVAPGVLFRGLLPLLLACRITGLSAGRY
ncbi:MAG: oligosaccharide flippase family protein, partial [Gemmataceae bacterium]|nr:oligosaccharide flippase family protein [Gemmataceae bacterium]